MKYPIAERFFAPQGEGLFTGTPCAFVRFVGCSVGKGICTACDTDFDRMYPDLGGGLYTEEDLIAWMGPYRHTVLTGGEPLDRNLSALIKQLEHADITPHIETSGTVKPPWLTISPWVCVSPKPGYLPEMIARADEIKVILGGLGDGPGWPTVEQAVAWARAGRLVYLQPRNGRLNINVENMQEVLSTVHQYPTLRVSAQLHKYLRTR